MNAIFILPAVFYALTSTLGQTTSGQNADSPHSSRVVVNLRSFGAVPNDPGINSRLPFQQALEKLRTFGGGTLSIPAGDYYLDFPDIASDVDPQEPNNRAILRNKNLTTEKLILVPRGVIVQGMLDKAGKPGTRIHWSATGFPLLGFVNSDNSGAKNLSFVFDGVQPQFFPWAQEDFLEAVGYKSRWLGGPYEISTVIYTIGSNNLRFINLTFQSSRMPADNEHTFAFGIVSNGKNPVPLPDNNFLKTLSFGTRIPGGGLLECVSGNFYRSLRFQEFVMGILATAQCDATFEDIAGNDRGSWFRSFDPTHETGPQIKYIGPPGHLIYLSFQNAYDVERSPDAPAGVMRFHSTVRNTNVTLRNIREGPKTLSNVNSLGTLALKDMEGGLVTDVDSQHPAGLIQSMVDAHNVRLENLRWASDRDICDLAKSLANCGVPVITLEPGPLDSESQFSSGLQFKNITLHGMRRSIFFKVSEEDPQLPLSRNITVDGLTIESPIFAEKQESPIGVITVRANATHFSSVRYIPIISSDGTSDRLNYPAMIQSRSQATSIEIVIDAGKGAGSNAPVYKCAIEGRRNQLSVSETNNRCVIIQRQ
jgi:hypothetical protein